MVGWPAADVAAAAALGWLHARRAVISANADGAGGRCFPLSMALDALALARVRNLVSCRSPVRCRLLFINTLSWLHMMHLVLL